MTHPDDATLQRWFDDELDDANQRDEIAAHLSDCDRCRRLVQGLTSLRGAVRAWADEVPPPAADLVSAVLRAAAVREPVRKARVIPLRRWAWPLVAVAAAALLAIGPSLQRPPRTRTAVAALDSGPAAEEVQAVMGADVVRVEVVGAKSYAVLQVPGMLPGATTAVVWIQDEPEDTPSEPGTVTVQ